MRNRNVIIRSRSDGVKTPADVRATVKMAIRAALSYENIDFPTEISITFVNNNVIRKYNLEYRGIDRDTGVLSFPAFENANDAKKSFFGKPVALGDIVISLEKAESQAEEFGHSILREAGFLAVHSLLHLLGYDHERSDGEERDMFDRQEKILAGIGLTR